MASPLDAAAVRLILSGRVPYTVVSGTTAATANTAATLAHTLQDDKGRALIPAYVFLTKKTNTTSGVFVNAAGNTSAVIDVRADGAVAIAYDALLIAAIV